MDAFDIFIRAVAVIGVGALATFVGYGIPAILRRMRASKRRPDDSATTSATDNRLARQ